MTATQREAAEGITNPLAVLARISHIALENGPVLRCWLLIFVRARGLVAARAAEFLDIFMIAKVCSCGPWMMPPEFRVATARVRRVSRAR